MTLFQSLATDMLLTNLDEDVVRFIPTFDGSQVMLWEHLYWKCFFTLIVSVDSSNSQDPIKAA